ncbi:MAG TPA: hypothetical protein VLW85_02595, partial [Myxococcales bacterium]|nr:hypothetical protein [Myxococcales bacterium]
MLIGAFLAAACGTSGQLTSDDDARNVSLVQYEHVCSKASIGFRACHALRRTDMAPQATLQPFATPSGLGPSQLASAYNLPSSGGAGITVAI